MGNAAVLTILRNGETVKSVTLDGPEVVLGRGAGCVIRLDDRAISRQHAIFRPLEDGVQVERKSEFAPLMINGAEATRGIVKEGDVIHIGPYLVKLTMEKRAKASLFSEPSAPSPTDATEAITEMASALPAETVAMAAPVPVAQPVPASLSPAPAPEQTGSGLGIESTQALALPSGESGEISPLPSLDDPMAGTPGMSLDPPSGGPLEALPGGLEAPAEFNLSPPEESPVEQGRVEFEQVDENASTRVGAADLAVKMSFPEGMANYVDFQWTEAHREISIGRGTDCDVVLNTKKASRKHAVISRDGMNFTIRDLESANGTWLNGQKVTEARLTGDDRIRIAGIEFDFKIQSEEYLRKEKDFMQLPPDTTQAGGSLPPEAIPSMPQLDFDAQGGAMSPEQAAALSSAPEIVDMPAYLPQGRDVPPPYHGTPGAPGLTGEVPGILGIPGAGGPKKKQGIVEWYRGLPPKRQRIVAILALAFVYLFLDDEDMSPVQPKKSKGVVAVSGVTGASGVSAGTGAKSASFKALSAEKRRFVETQNALALDHLKAREYDKALYEVRKIFDIIDDYGNSKEIERYAMEGKRRLEAMEEEKRKKEEEARLKAQVTQLVADATELMKRRQYDQAREMFYQILSMDPENPTVAGWRKEIEDYEEKKKLEDQQRQVQAEINNRAWDMVKEGMALKRAGKCRGAIGVFSKVGDVGASDGSALVRARQLIAECKASTRAQLEPLLAEGKRLEDGQELGKAYQAYEKAARVDPDHPAAYAGMNRIRGVLHDRARVLYTEAVLSESYSDFSTARKKYAEILEFAPLDDIYNARAKRKMGKFLKREEASQP
jgi:pSer/pThr/pTyr-binding forkhead associated (FHA) protein/tetratricopeptide (TPR) repeat protein